MKPALDMVNDHMSEMADATYAEMDKMQPSPPGMRARSERELSNIWAAITALPKDVQLTVIQSMAERSGHKDGEEAACETCDFLRSRVNAGG